MVFVIRSGSIEHGIVFGKNGLLLLVVTVAKNIFFGVFVHNTFGGGDGI
jgi:hypothetical protein